MATAESSLNYTIVDVEKKEWGKDLSLRYPGTADSELQPPNVYSNDSIQVHVSACIYKKEWGSELSLRWPATADSELHFNAGRQDEVPPIMANLHNEAADGCSGNLDLSRPCDKIAPSANAKGLYWCQDCKNLTESSQWRRVGSDRRDLFNPHGQKRYRQIKKSYFLSGGSVQ